MLLITVAVLPTIIILFFVLYKDKHKKDDRWMLTTLFLLGMLTVIPAGYINDKFFPTYLVGNIGLLELLLRSVFVVGLGEEGLKFIMLSARTWKSKGFVHGYDGIVYAVVVSLGFATVENIMYVLQNGLITGLLRAIASVPGHAIFAVSMGYYYSLAKKTKIPSRRRKLISLSLIIPMLIHGIFDFLLMSNMIFLLMGYVIFLLFLYNYAFEKIDKMSEYNNWFNKTNSLYYRINVQNKEFQEFNP